MVNNNETSQTPEDSSKLAKKTTHKTQDQKSGNKRICAFVIALTFLTALIALALGLYATYLGQQWTAAAQDQAKALTQLAHNQENTNKSLGAAGEISETQSQLQNEVHSLTQQFQANLRQQTYRPDDWVLLKARFYLELAQVNSHWSDDQSTSIALLQQADSFLKTLSDQGIVPIREEITKVILQLQALPQNDVVNLLSQIQAIEALITNLPPQEPHVLGINDASTTTPVGKEATWKERLQRSLKSLEKLVVIRRDDDTVQLPLSPLHQTLIRDLISMNLQEARWAILQNNNDIYHLALKHALEAITRNFTRNSSELRTITAQLQALMQINLHQERPRIESPLTLLNAVIETKSQASPTSMNPKEKK